MDLNPLAADLDHILEHTHDLWAAFHGERLFITGGTGFFGCWLLESFTWAVDRLDLKTQAVVLTRNTQAFKQKAPHLANHPAVHLWNGDVRSFDFPDGQFAHIIHAATESSTKQNDEDPLQMLDTLVQGTQRTLEFARASGATNFLLTSSGAVYGKQPLEISHIPEDFKGGPDVMQPASAYGEGKRLAELICAVYEREYHIKSKIARCFAFVGPYLLLDIHFAIGNFIRDGLQNNPIEVKGDGSPCRSYLYAADLAAWLWTILISGKTSHPYNVGSEGEVSIAELAHKVAKAFSPSPCVKIAQESTKGAPIQRYIPCVKRAREELGLEQWVTLDKAIQKTIDWHKRK